MNASNFWLVYPRQDLLGPSSASVETQQARKPYIPKGYLLLRSGTGSSSYNFARQPTAAAQRLDYRPALVVPLLSVSIQTTLTSTLSNSTTLYEAIF